MTNKRLNPLIFVIIIAISLLIYSSSAQDYDSKGKPLVTHKTPFNTVMIYLRSLKPESYQPEIAAKALNIKNPKSTEAQNLAIKLSKIFEGNHLLINLDKITKDSNYIDSKTGMSKFLLFKDLPDIYLEKYDGKWLFSTHTVELIPKLYNDTYHYNSEDFIEMLPEFWNQYLFNLRYWQYVALIIYFAMACLIYYLLKYSVGFLLIKIGQKVFNQTFISKYIQKIARPLSFLLVLMLVDEFLVLLQLPIKFSYYINIIIKIFVPVSITYIIYRLSNIIFDSFEKIASKTASKANNQLIPILRTSFKIIIFIFGAMYVMNNLNINITPFLAGVSIGGLAFALAAQDTVRNFFGSVTIFTDKPFEVGDWIVFDGTEGTVEEVGIRSSRVRTFYDSQITIPNGKLCDMKIDNMGRRKFSRYITKFSISYKTPPDLIDTFVSGLRKIVEEHPYTRKDLYNIYLNDLSDSAIIILFHIFFDTKENPNELESRHQILSQVIRLASELEVKFAFPSKSVYIESIPEIILPIQEQKSIE
jgi:MscS family membrane protein